MAMVWCIFNISHIFYAEIEFHWHKIVLLAVFLTRNDVQMFFKQFKQFWKKSDHGHLLTFWLVNDLKTVETSFEVSHDHGSRLNLDIVGSSKSIKSSKKVLSF